MFKAFINAAGTIVIGLFILAMTVYLAAAGFPFRKYGGRAWEIAKDAGDELAQIAHRARAAEDNPDNTSVPPAEAPHKPAEDNEPAGSPDSAGVTAPVIAPDSAAPEPVEAAEHATPSAIVPEAAPVEEPPADALSGPVEAPAQPPENDAGDTGALVHKVHQGDTLFGISRKYYGTGSRWKAIAAANGIEDPGTGLRVGREIVIPPATESARIQ